MFKRLFVSRTTMFAVLILLPIAKPALCGDDGAPPIPPAEQQLWDSARQCSETMLRRYALSGTEPAEKVAEAAFDKCKELWGKAAEVGGRRIENGAIYKETQANCIHNLGAANCSTHPSSSHFMEAMRTMFIRTATTEVFDIRAEAAGK